MKKAAFSTIEILVALGVVTVLITMSTFGFTTIQKSSRDSARKSLLGEIALEINSYKRKNLNYPTNVQFTSTSVTIEGQNVKTLTGYLSAGSSTSSSSTSYYYEKSIEGEYALCVKLESGKIQSLGTLDCAYTSFGGLVLT